jgi:hypothetical protein
MRQFPICLIFALTLVLGAGGAAACGGLLQPPCPPPYNPPLNADGSLQVISSLAPLPAPVTGEPLFERGAHVQVGFNDLARDTGQVFGNDANVATLTQAIGGTIARSAIDWGQAQPSKTGGYVWKTWDDMYRGLVEHDVRPIFSIEGSPQWAADDLTACISKTHGCTTGPQAQYVDRYAAFVAAVAQRYPLAAAVEIWNEPNYHSFWKHPDPRAYTTLLQRSYAAVKRTRPTMRVLGGALQCGTRPRTNAVTGDDIPLEDFLRAIEEAGAGSSMDGLSFHPYPTSTDLEDSTGNAFRQAFDTIERVLGAETTRRLIVDETGWQTADNTDEPNEPNGKQSKVIQAVFHRIDDADSPLPLHAQVDLLLFHTDVWVDTDRFGWTVVTSTGYDPKPVLCDIVELTAAPPCASIVAQH